MEEYYYKVYGLNVKSNIKFDELTSIKVNIENFDVSIKFGDVPHKLEKSIFSNRNMQFTKTETCFYIENLAYFYISNGNNIIIELINPKEITRLKLYILGGCMGEIFAQRNAIAIHGSTVVFNEKGIIITGDSGSGKSSLTTAFIQDGHKFLADDVSVLDKNAQGTYIIYPAYPQQKLCNNTIEALNLGKYRRNILDKKRSKYAVTFYDSFLFSEVPLYVLFELCIGSIYHTKVTVTELQGKNKIISFINSIYGVDIRKYKGINSDFFKMCLDISKSIRIFKIIRPPDIYTVNEQLLCIKDIMTKI